VELKKNVPKNRQDLKYCSVKCADDSIDHKKSRAKAVQTLVKKYGMLFK